MPGRWVMTASEGTRFLMPSHPLTDFEIQKYYQNEINWLMFTQEITYLKKDRENVINLHEYKSVGTHWIALFFYGDNVA